MITVSANNISTLWYKLLGELRATGTWVNPRSLQTKEVLGVRLHLDQLRNNVLVCPERNLNYRYLVAEWIWYMTGSPKKDLILPYNSKLDQFSNGDRFDGSYGEMLMDQWVLIRDRLHHDPVTRQAVLCTWRPGLNQSKDYPCTLTWQFLIRDGLLNLIVNMRSSDAWLGIPYDLYAFSQIANTMAAELGRETGWLQVNLGSSHFYSTELDAVVKVLNSDYKFEYLRSPELPRRLSATSYTDLLVDKEELLCNNKNPYHWYHAALRGKTSANALECLRSASRL
jgi:thymidylate synthase